MRRGLPLLAIAALVAAALLLFFGLSRNSDGSDPRSDSDLALQDSASVLLRDSADSGSASLVPNPSDAFLLALDGEGLRLFDAASGSSRPLSFGTEGSLVGSALVRVLGAEPVEVGYSEDCAAEYQRWPEGLSIWIVRDDFVGWSLRDDGTTLTTPTGIGIGSTRADLEESYAAEIYQSTLGIEFVAGGLAGLLESEDDDASITNLWAGQTCIAR